jgi:tetratricopeptide (TPR) repeat protein
VLSAEPDADTVAALAELATLEAFAGNSAEAERGSAAALAEAQALDLPDAVLSGLLSIRGVAHGMASRPVQAIANLREAVRRAESAQDSAAAARALLNLADQLISIDAPAAVEATRASLAHCRRIGFRYVMRFGAANLIHALLLTGDWDSARQAYATAVDEDELGDGLAVAQSGAVLHALSGDRGRLAGTLDVVERSDSEDPQDLANSATAMAVAAALGGDHAQAFSHAMEALRHGEALGLRNDAVRWAWSIGVDAALAMGELADANRLLGWLDEHPAGHIPPVLRAERLRLVARCRAAEGEPETAAAFDAAVKALRDVCSPFHLAVGLLDHAEHLAATTDPRRARELAVEAQAIARELGAGSLLERAATLVHEELSGQVAR